MLSKHRWNANVETAVCFNQSPSPPLQNQGVDSQSTEPQRDTGGDIDRYKEMKREKTHTEIERDVYREKEFFLPSLKIFAENQTKANQNVCF